MTLVNIFTIIFNISSQILDENNVMIILKKENAVMKDYTGSKCKGCGDFIRYYDEVKVCSCGAPYHKDCWEKAQACSKCHSTNKTERIITPQYLDETTSMFSNIGDKIKGLAVFVTVIGIIAGIITTISMCIADDDLIIVSLLTGAAIGLSSWIGSFMLYGFGALISYAQKSAAFLSLIVDELKSREK